MYASLVIYGTSEMLGFWLADYSVASLELFGSYKKKLPWSIVFHVLSALYFWSRFCLIAEAVISTRDLPKEAFLQAPWTQWLPRIS